MQVSYYNQVGELPAGCRRLPRLEGGTYDRVLQRANDERFSQALVVATFLSALSGE